MSRKYYKRRSVSQTFFARTKFHEKMRITMRMAERQTVVTFCQINLSRVSTPALSTLVISCRVVHSRVFSAPSSFGCSNEWRIFLQVYGVYACTSSVQRDPRWIKPIRNKTPEKYRNTKHVLKTKLFELEYEDLSMKREESSAKLASIVSIVSACVGWWLYVSTFFVRATEPYRQYIQSSVYYL